jgi:hypothetical protein
MTTVSVRISEEEKKELLRYGRLSDSVRKGLRLYLREKKSEEVLRRLEKLQAENPVKTSVTTDLRQIREDRRR